MEMAHCEFPFFLATPDTTILQSLFSGCQLIHLLHTEATERKSHNSTFTISATKYGADPDQRVVPDAGRLFWWRPAPVLKSDAFRCCQHITATVALSTVLT